MALNEFQQAVVNAKAAGQQVVEACPGSGKTYTFENLICELISSGVDPSRIVAFTFSNKGAGEMRWRVASRLLPASTETELAYLESPTDKIRTAALEESVKIPARTWSASDPLRKFVTENITTIHAFCFRTLRNIFGYEIQVIDSAEISENGRRQQAQWLVNAIVKDGLAELDWDVSPNAVFYWFGRAINALIEPPQSEEWFAVQLSNRGGPVWAAGKLAELYKRYHGFCHQHGLVDFNMMQARLLFLVRNSREARERLGTLYDYVIVDEAQDTDDSPQCEIIWSLVRENIVFIGDVDQSLYIFRGARPEVMRSEFEARWPAVQRFNLPVNYRSTRNIIQASAGLIADNYPDQEQYLKPFQAREDAPDGEPVKYIEAETFSGLTDEIAIAVKENPGDWFVLSRTRAECAAIHTTLIAADIPAINKSGGLLFGAPHIRKVLAYARLACNYRGARDNKEILYEIANVASANFRAPMTRRRHLPTCHETRTWVSCGCPIVMEEGNDYSHARYYGQKAIDQAGGRWVGVIQQQDDTNRGGYPTLNAKGAADLVRFVTKIEKMSGNAHAALNAIIQGCVLPWLKAEEGIDDEDLAENGKAEDFDLLLSLTEPDQTLEQYLSKVEELSQGIEGNESESVLIGTVHWSKGAERPCVFVNSTRLPIVPPTLKPGALPTTNPPTKEEERRLMFVAITRAKDQCVIGGALEWNGQKTTRSEFVQTMIDRNLIEFGRENSDNLCPECGNPVTINANKIAACQHCRAVTWDEPEEDEAPCLLTGDEHAAAQEASIAAQKADVMDSFPTGGRLENGICRFAAADFVREMGDGWTQTIEKGQLALVRQIAGDVSIIVLTGIAPGHIAPGSGEDSIRIVLREGDRYRKGDRWTTRTYPTKIWASRGLGYAEAVAHIVHQKVLPKVEDLIAGVRICPDCGGAQVRLTAKDKRTYWKCRQCPEGNNWKGWE